MVRRRPGPRGNVEGRGAGLIASCFDLVFPRACVSCRHLLDRGERGLVCGRCWSRVANLPAPRCDRCGHPTSGQPCRWCALLPPRVRAARSVCWATRGAGMAIVHAFKYSGWYRVAEEMSARMARLSWPRDVIDERAFVVPVPLYRKRERDRAYNPA